MQMPDLKDRYDYNADTMKKVSSLTVSPAGSRDGATDEVVQRCRFPARAGLRLLASVLLVVQACKRLQVWHMAEGLLRFMKTSQPVGDLRNFSKPRIAAACSGHKTQFRNERLNANLPLAECKAKCRFANDDVPFPVVLNRQINSSINVNNNLTTSCRQYRRFCRDKIPKQNN